MKYLRLFSNIVSVTGWCAAFLFFMFYYRFAFNYEIEINDQYYLVFTIPLLLLSVLPKILDFASTFSLSKMLWMLTVIVICLLLAFSRYYSFGNEYFVVVSAVFFINSSVAFSFNKVSVYIIFSVLILTFFVELYIGTQQWLEAYNYGDDTTLAVQGTLQNSGIYACYLVVHVPLLHFAFSSFIDKTRKRLYAVLFGTVYLLLSVSIIFLIYQTQSRTSWLALFATAAGWIILTYGTALKRKVSQLSRAVLITLIVVIASVSSFAMYYLFMMKKMSAVGRLMRTEIALQHIGDHFWLGTGVGRFTWYYPQWQAEYFNKTPHPPKDYFLSADESYIIFNEYLQLFETVGLVGMVGLLLLFVYIFTARSVKYKTLLGTVKLTAIAILACGFTSYPLHVNVFLLLLAFCFGVAVSVRENHELVFNGSFSEKLTKPLLLLFLVVTFFLGYEGIEKFAAFTEWKGLRKENDFSENETGSEYQKFYPVLQSDGKFLTEYGEFLLEDSTEFKNTIGILEDAKRYYISYRTIIALVEAYELHKNYPKAIGCLKWLSNFLPNKFAPRYKLMKVYQRNKDNINAKKNATIITNMPIKIPSSEINRIKREATIIMKDYNND